MVSTAARASPTVPTPAVNLFHMSSVAAPAAGAPAARNVFSRAALLPSASKALDSPRKAFCASKGMRCTTRESCSAGAATEALLCESSVSAAAAATQSTTSAASTGRRLTLEFVTFCVAIFVPVEPSARGLQETLALHQALQAQHRPNLAAAAKGAGQIT